MSAALIALLLALGLPIPASESSRVVQGNAVLPTTTEESEYQAPTEGEPTPAEEEGGA